MRFEKNDTVLYGGEVFFIDKHLRHTNEFVLVTLDGKQELTISVDEVEPAP